MIEFVDVVQDPVVRAQAGKSSYGYDKVCQSGCKLDRLCGLLQLQGSRVLLGLVFSGS